MEFLSWIEVVHARIILDENQCCSGWKKYAGVILKTGRADMLSISAQCDMTLFFLTRGRGISSLYNVSSVWIQVYWIACVLYMFSIFKYMNITIWSEREKNPKLGTTITIILFQCQLVEVCYMYPLFPFFFI